MPPYTRYASDRMSTTVPITNTAVRRALRPRLRGRGSGAAGGRSVTGAPPPRGRGRAGLLAQRVELALKPPAPLHEPVEVDEEPDPHDRERPEEIRHGLGARIGQRLDAGVEHAEADPRANEQHVQRGSRRPTRPRSAHTIDGASPTLCIVKITGLSARR